MHKGHYFTYDVLPGKGEKLRNDVCEASAAFTYYLKSGYC